MRFIEFLVEFEPRDEYWVRDETKSYEGVVRLIRKSLARNPEARTRYLEDFGKYIRKARNDDVYQKLMRDRNRYRQAIDNEDWRLAAIIAYDAFQEHTNVLGHKSYMFASDGMSG